jgi:mRNA interferase YafQ
LKKVQKRGYDISLLTDVIKKLANGEELPARNRDHVLSGDYAGLRECHVTPDWLLVYEIDDESIILYLTRTGTHSDLF